MTETVREKFAVRALTILLSHERRHRDGHADSEMNCPGLSKRISLFLTLLPMLLLGAVAKKREGNLFLTPRRRQNLDAAPTAFDSSKQERGAELQEKRN